MAGCALSQSCWCWNFFWVATAWEGGQLAITFAAVVITLFSPREEEAFGLSIGFAEGTAVTIALAATVQFAVLPAIQGFWPLCAVLGVVLIPLAAISTGTWHKAIFVAMMMNFMPILGPANVPSYDPASFLNTAMAILVGTGAAAVAMRLLPPLPARIKISRLHRLTLQDLRRLVRPDTEPRPGWRRADWESRVYARLLAMPAIATELDTAQLLAAMSSGEEVLRLRALSVVLGVAPLMRTMEAELSFGRVDSAAAALQRLRDAVAAAPAVGAGRLRALASIDVLAETLLRHGAYLGGVV